MVLSPRLRLHIRASKVHRWLALLIGAQAIVWFTSGFVMSLLPIDTVRGDHRIDRNAEPALSSAQGFAPISALLTSVGEPVRQLQHRVLLGRPVVEVQFADGHTSLLDARTAAALPPVDAKAARMIARRAYQGVNAPATAVERIEHASTEYRGALPAWRVSFADQNETRIYVAAETGRLTSVRTGTWRLYDFFWGLHIMDWTEHDRFNTPRLNVFAAGGLVFAVSGAILLFMRWPRRSRRNAGGRTLKQGNA